MLQMGTQARPNEAIRQHKEVVQMKPTQLEI